MNLPRVLPFVFLCVCAVATAAPPDSKTTDSSTIQWREFQRATQRAATLVVYVGIPRSIAKQDTAPANAIERGGYRFHPEPVSLTPEVAAQLEAIMADPSSFPPYRGAKLCGGFHPDLLLEWHHEHGEQSWIQQAFACLGCHEWRLIDPTTAVHTDMSQAAAENIGEIHTALTPHQP